MNHIILMAVVFFVIYLALYVGIVFIFSVAYYVNSKRIVNLLIREVNPEKFLEEVDKQISKRKDGKIKKLLYINKSAGLIYDGRFKEAINLLNSIDPKQLKNVIEVLYYNNLLYAFLINEDFEEAKRLYDDCREILNKGLNMKQLKHSVENTIAVFNFYLGDISESKSILSRLHEQKLPLLSYIEVEYFSCLVKIKEGDEDRGLKQLNDLLKIPESAYLNIRVRKEKILQAKREA